MSINQSPSEWYRWHWQELKEYVGEWVAYSRDGVISHDRDYLTMMERVKLDPMEYIIERIYENEFVEPIKFYPVRFRTVKANNWQPKYLVKLSYQEARQLNILVDSGADFCLMPKQLGIDLGYRVGGEEVMSKAEGVGGEVDYVLRRVELSIDSHTLTVPIAWLQTDDAVECLLGREVVFDKFDIEFKQRDRQIIFKYRVDR
ncbi:aspartyl protease family protein [Chamaesiphon sp. OTE_8_metabat_110]|uniref:aspartyl protease family protein n=1 Tax=Chamaesiphon sp. OTE_8_metabat_110 TaxID=2964696 RepID=UPI00286CFBB5|nr:aspartyl protease family protein [Chamaesiphon sp. OTE_8_metabat_110]